MTQSGVPAVTKSRMSETLTITLPDGSQKQAAPGTTVGDFVRSQIGQGLAKAALFARLDDEDRLWIRNKRLLPADI